jgi:hypothetical protein
VKRPSTMRVGRGVSIIEATEDPVLFARWFRKRETWAQWFAFLKVLFGLPLGEAELETFRLCTGRQTPPTGGTREAHLICGRRAGKSFILALTAVYLACFHEWRGCLSPGERGTIMVIAADRKQARVIFRYIVALLKVKLIASMVERHGAEFVDLNNSVTIEIQTASFRTTRGYSLVACLCDELAFWRSDESSANPDSEIVAALRPSMATVPGSMLLCASSPYARRGVLWDAFRKYHGKDGPVLVWKAETRTMNPTVPQAVIDEAYEADPASAAAEYGASFRTDVETFVAREVVESVVMRGRFELPRGPGVYFAFTDPSGGSADSFTLAIAHRRTDNVVVLDAIREVRPPFSPEAVCDEFAKLLKSYGITTIQGDKFAGEWPVEQFRKFGIRYEQSAAPKSDLYRDLLPILNSGRCELLDNARLIAQLCQLERRVARSGKDSIDHPPGAHDDISNACAGAFTLALGRVSIFTHENMQRVLAECAVRPPYRRPMHTPEQRTAMNMALIGERRFFQLMRQRGR